jgi:GDPmannose 4,6-dehydratase
MWSMLQQDEPDDYVIASGVAHSVADFAQVAFDCANLDWREFVKTDDSLFRPAEVDHLVGDSSKARAKFGWRQKMSFAEMVALMVEHDIYRLKNGLPLYAPVEIAAS